MAGKVAKMGLSLQERSKLTYLLSLSLLKYIENTTACCLIEYDIADHTVYS
jgi:hypothetical protein